MSVRVLAGSMAPDRHRVLRQTFVALAFVLVWALAGRALAASGAYRPGVTIALEVRTPQGDLRSFQQPGHAPTYWTPDLPVVKGDQLTITPLVTTGGAELAEVTIRLDESPLTVPPGPDRRVVVDTSRLAPGYHLVEVWAATKAPKRGENSAATTFLLVPGTDPLLQMLAVEGSAGPPVSDEERLAVAIRSPDEHVDEELTTSSSATIRKETQLSISAGPAVKEYFYTLSRDGAVTYTSPRLPVETLVVIAPQAGDNVGLVAGKVTFTVRGGDGAGRFGAPAWVTLDIVSPEAPK